MLMVTPEDIYIKLGRWKHIIVFDLYNAFYQNHIYPEDQQWLGIITPFGGLRVLTRSGQGLLGQSKELDELLAKVMQDKMAAGICMKIQDNVIVGGDTQEEAEHNYILIIKILYLANLRVAPDKTIIFPKSTNIAGWIW